MTTEGSKWECKRCGYETIYKHSLIRHLQRERTCPSRNSDCLTERLLTELQHEFAKERCYICEFCGKSFVSRVGKSKHKKQCQSRRATSSSGLESDQTGITRMQLTDICARKLTGGSVSHCLSTKFA